MNKETKILSRKYISHLLRSVEDGYDEKSKLLDDHIHNLEGMTPPKTRHFLNSLCSMDGARYLEIGLFKGASFLCANYQNPDLVSAGIENFSEFQDEDHMTNGKTVGQSFDEQMNRFSTASDRVRIRVIKQSAFQVDLSNVFRPNIYFYDGEHSARSHELALTHFDKCLDDTFILVVDDWCCSLGGPRNGTLSAIHKLGYQLRYYEELFFQECKPTVFVAVVEKGVAK